MLRLLIAAALWAPLCAPPAPAKADIRPKPSGDFLTPGLEVHQIDGQENVRIVNDTQLYMSAKFVALGTQAKVLQSHVSGAFTLYDKNLVGPQEGLNWGYWAGTTDFGQPQGRNCIVDVLTPGFGRPARALSSAEQSLRYRLMARGIVDSIVLPFLTSASGHPQLKGNSKHAQVLATFLFSQNHALWKDLNTASGPRDAVVAVFSALLRDLAAAGPLTSFLADTFGEAIVAAILKKLGQEIALEIGSTALPPAKIVLYAMRLLNWGPTAAQIANWIYDSANQPSLVRFTVLFKTGVSGLYPRQVHAGRKTNVITITGYKLNAPGPKPVVLFYDDRDNLVFKRAAHTVTRAGDSLDVRVPGAAVAGKSGALHCYVQLASGETHELPERIKIIDKLLVDGCIPESGHPKQRIRIAGRGFHPYVTANRVFFGTSRTDRTEAKLVAATKTYLEVEVPPLSESPSKVQVWVEERYGSTTAESDPVPFERLPGTLEEAEGKRLKELMPETDQVLEGVLTPENPRYVKAIKVAAGMQIVATLDSLAGPESNPHRFALGPWGLSLLANRGGRRVRYWVAQDPGPVVDRQPGRTLQHTTEGGRGANVYYLQLDHKSGKEIRFRVRVQTVAKGDAGQGRDAGNRAATALDLRTGGPYACFLYGDPEKFREDRRDWFRIPEIPGGDRLRVTIHRIGAGARTDAALHSVTLYRVRNHRLERAAAVPGGLRAADGDAVLDQEDTETRTCYLEVLHGTGLVDYRVSVAIETMDGGPSDKLPITSRFNDGIDDNWTVTGNFTSGSRAPQLRQDGRADGYLRADDGTAGAGAPLDVAFVVDTTGSMGGAIESVRTGTQAIVRELRRRSSSLRVGVVSFKDYAADRGSARSVQELSEDVEARLTALGGLSAAGGGGDGPEDALYGLEGALEMGWRAKDDRGREVARVVMLITDAPFKLSGDKDFGGRSIRSMALAARGKGITVYPMPVSQDATLRAQSTSLARQTQGVLLRVENAAAVAQAIQDIMEFAVDSSSPRYFNAPAKFLGDVSRFYGRCLAWETRGASSGRKFNDPDVLLRGAGRTLYLQSALAPPPGDGGARRDFRRSAVRLTADHRWYVKETGERATEAQFLEVLRALESIQLRGEFYAGSDWCDLDNVVLGGAGPATDAGLTDTGLETLDWFVEFAERLRREHAQLEADFGSPWELLTQHYKAAGVSDPRGAALSDISTVKLALYHVRNGGPSVIDALYDVERKRLEQNIAYFRRRGGIPKEARSAALADVKQLRQRLAGFEQARKVFLDTLATRAKLRRARDKATGTAWYDLGRSIQQADKNVRKGEQILDGLRSPVSIRLLGGR